MKIKNLLILSIRNHPELIEGLIYNDDIDRYKYRWYAYI